MDIKRRAKMIIAVLLAVMLFAGCTPFDDSPDSLLVAPKLSGEMHPVQKALDKKINGKYQLKFPTSGETKSAITLVDLDGDGLSEGVAFYSINDNNSVTMNIAVIAFDNNEWKVVAQESIVAGGVGQVYFTDMDGDSTKEIVVGWNVYGSANKTVSVYEYSGQTLIKLIEENFAEFLLCDLDGNLSQDLLIFQLDMTTVGSYVRYFGINSQGVSELGNCETDGNITSYDSVTLSKLPNGEFCVYADCIKGAGMITEVIYFKDGKLVSPFYDSELMENAVTYRPAIVPCRDYDNDGFIEIPVMRELPTDMSPSASAAYLTVWSQFDGDKLIDEAYTLMNYSDGYSIKLTKGLAAKSTAIRNLEYRERIICEYDYEKNVLKDEIFRIRVVSKSSYDSGIYTSDHVVLAKSESLVWIASISPKAKDYKITKENISEIFELILEE